MWQQPVPPPPVGYGGAPTYEQLQPQQPLQYPQAYGGPQYPEQQVQQMMPAPVYQPEMRPPDGTTQMQYPVQQQQEPPADVEAGVQNPGQETSATPAAPPAPGFFGRLMERIGIKRSADAGNSGGPAGGPSTLPPPPDPMHQAGDSKDPSDMPLLDYQHAFKIHEEDVTQQERLLFLQFQTTTIGRIKPVPAREAAIRAKRTPKEDYGLYTEPQPLLGMHSLIKMEQRVSSSYTIDKAVLTSLAGPSEEAAAMAQAAAARHAALTTQRMDKQQLVVGALPVLAEEAEDDTMSQHTRQHGSQAGSPARVLPGAGGSSIHQPVLPAVMTDPAQAWQALNFHQQGLMQVGAVNPAHPSHGMLLGVQQALQQMQAGGPMPLIGLDGMPLPPDMAAAIHHQQQQQQQQAQQQHVPGAGMVNSSLALKHPGMSPFLDDQGLLTYTADPTKALKERPGRRYDQDKEATATFIRRPIVELPGSAAEASHTYRLDIELTRLEFLVHPAMAHEDILAARLLAAFKEFKRREAVGLASFYANRLAALEESLLSARERLFELSEEAAAAAAAGPAGAAAIAAQGGAGGISAEAAAAAAGEQGVVVVGGDASNPGGQSDGMSNALREALAYTAKLEREVAETRQLKEEEELLMVRAVEGMQAVYGAILQERSQQGQWLTNLELTVTARPAEESQWTMGTGVPRDRLDAQLLAAEDEAISGLPPPPYAFPPPPSMEDLPQAGFRPRRIETMCASHKALVADLTNRLNALKGRPSADPASDPVILQLEDQLRALGKAPRRLGPRTPHERALAEAAAAQRVLAGDVGVPRIPRLIPILSVIPSQGQQGEALHPDQATNPWQAQGPLASHQQQMQAGVPGQATGASANTTGHRTRPAHMKAAAARSRYYVRVFVNGHIVDTSSDVHLNEDFKASFKDIFSVQVVRWPESIMVQLYEKGTVRDTPLASVYVGVPGLAGTPHVDPRPVAYQFTSQNPVRALGPLGQQQLLPPGSPGREVIGPTNNPNLIYPAGIVYVRCGWVADDAGPGARMGDQTSGSVLAYQNPLADGRTGAAGDVESGASHALVPPVPNITVDRLLRRAAERIGGKASRQQVLRWLSQNTLDPNDPRNAPLLELMRAHEATSGGLGDLFRLDVFPDVAISEDRQQGKRSNFLSRRWAAGAFRDPEKSTLKGVRQVRIPAILSARDADDLEHLYLDALALIEMAPGGSGPAVARALMARQDRAGRMQIGPELTKGVEEREARIKEFAMRIRAAANRIAGGKQAVRKYKTDDVVNDTPLPEFKVDLSTLSNLVAPRRPLKRNRKVIKSLVTSVPADTELMVTIQRATNLPQRRAGGPGSPGRANPRGGRDTGNTDQGATSPPPASNANNVQAFVEVRFRGISRRTVSASGDFPTFNEQVMLPVFGTEEEPSPSALYENNDVVTVNVFDEIINDRVGEPRVPRTNQEDGISDPVRYPERERRFLGCLRVPLSAVYQAQVLQGTLRLEVPPVMLGYQQRSERPPALSLYMSFKPRLAPPASLPEDVISGELEDVTRHARDWMAQLLELPQCRSRVLRTFAVDPDGTSLLVTRYVSPLPLPAQLHAAASTPSALPGISATESVMLKMARFVSLLPYLEDSALHKRRVDVWATCSEALYLAAGDAEEHAHLLAGYFLEIGQQALIVLGASTYGARSAFVLTTGRPAYDPANPLGGPQSYEFNELALRLWNPLTGNVVSVKDSMGEMREVGCVYDHANIWANIQVSACPWEMHWSLNDTRLFRPFFGPYLPPRPMGTVQTAPVYEERSDLFYEQLETRVEEAVRDALQKARSLGAFVTKPDNKVSRVLRSLLKEMPAAMEGVAAASLAASLALASLPEGAPPPEIGNGLNERHRVIKALQESHNERVLKEARADWVNGHILALPFSDRYAEAVSEAVLNTGIHRIADERVKYSMAAHVERSGVAFCACLWIYVAATR